MCPSSNLALGEIESPVPLTDTTLGSQTLSPCSPISLDHVPAAGLLQPGTPRRSVQNSTNSSTPKSRAADGDDIATPPLTNESLVNGSLGSSFTTIILRQPTRRATLAEEAWDKSYVLSFDGGGVRGLSTLYILKRLMLRIKHHERRLNASATSSYHPLDCPHDVTDSDNSTAGYYPCHYFDYMAGTSTGGLIAIMLSRLRMDVDDTIDEFTRLAAAIFGKPRTFSIRGPILWNRPKHDYRILENAVQEILNTRLPKLRHQIGDPQFKSNQEMCRTMVIAHGKSEEGHEDAHIFRSYDHLQPFYPDDLSIRNPGPADAIDIEIVARATSAAPTYFKAVKVGNRKLGDGGLGCNNPAWEAYNEVQDMHNSDDNAIALLISIGTGESYIRRFAQVGGFTEALQTLRAATGLATDTHRVDENLQKITRKRKDSYYRFNADNRLGAIKLNSWKKAKGKRPSTVQEMQRITEEYLNNEEVALKLDRVANILVQNRKTRSKSERWEARLYGLKWRCYVENCPEGHQARRKSELEEHLKFDHGYGPVSEQSAAVRADYEELIRRGRYEAT